MFVFRRHFFATMLTACVIGSSPALAATLTAGSPPSSAPTTFLNTKTGKIEGFMPDIAAEVARRQNLDLKFEAVIFSTLIQSVVSGKIDMIVAGMSPNPKRAEVIDFSQPVTTIGEGIFVRDDAKEEIKSAQDFKGLVVGVMAGTEYGMKLQSMNIAKEIRFYDSPADLARDVSLGRIALGMNDYPILKGQEAAGAMKGLHVVDHYEPLKKSDIAFGVKKGNTELLEKINQSLADMKKDGSLEKILAKWGMGNK